MTSRPDAYRSSSHEERMRDAAKYLRSRVELCGSTVTVAPEVAREVAALLDSAADRLERET